MLACALLSTAGLAVISSPAQGARPHQFTSSFAEPCLAEPCEGAQLKEPQGVAVNEASGDVYVVDRGANRVVRFSASGAFLSEFNGSGLLAGEETAAGGLGRPGEVETGRFERPETIAVDNSCVLRRAADPELTQEECEAQDPSNGDVYVVDAGHLVVDKYSPSGKYLGQISEGEKEPPARFTRVIDGVAVDAAGHPWVLQENREIGKYSNSVTNGFESLTTLGLLDFPVPGSLAVDSKGNFYLIHGPGEATSGLVAKISPSGATLNEELDEELSTAVAVDQKTDNPYICNIDTIASFNPEGAPIERLGRENEEEHLSKCNGIGVNASSGTLYASDAGTDTVVIFGPAQPTVPRIEEESFSEVTSEAATLAARINPQSESGEAPTEYVFQYGRCQTAASCPGSGYEASVPVPAGQIPASFEGQEVSVEVKGLQPGSTYHFRVLAKNSHGEGPSGEERTFSTEGGGGQLTLADDRGWELVSPPQKQGALVQPFPEEGVVQAAADGTGITYLANLPTEAEPQGYSNLVQVLSRRSSASWSSRDIALPHTSATGFSLVEGPEYKFFTPDLSQGAVQPFGEFIPQLSEEASESTAYLHDLSEGCGSHCFRPLVTGKPGFANVPEGAVFGEEGLCKPQVGGGAKEACGPQFLGASEDLRHVVLRSRAELVPGGGGEGLYEWSGGTLSRVSVLPGVGEEAATSPGLGVKASNAARGAISTDGSRVFWSTTANLYLRDTSRGETLQLDKGTCGGCESGGGVFQIASADGSRVFFTGSKRLTEDSGANPNPGSQEADLYECRIPLGTKPACELTDLTPPRGEEGANVQGSVLGASEDGQYVYFVAKGVQSEAANAQGQKAAPGKPNLYVRHGGATSFIATLSAGDEHDWRINLLNQPTRVSPDGRWLTLMSEAPLTGYDNRDAQSGKPAAEVYVFDAQSGRLECASCLPSGARPAGVEYKKLLPSEGGIVGGSGIWPANALVAANVPGWTAIGGLPERSRYQPRYLNNEGRTFFNTLDALVPQDANGTQDVYEYEPPGVGSCSEESSTFSARSGGCVSLISSGRSAQESGFLDASESGDDVFFITSAKLSPLDVDSAFDVYDAHVCTGAEPCIAFPNVESPPCTNESSCKAPPTPQPQIFGAPASATFQGPGNQTPEQPKPKVKTAEEIRIEHLEKALKACRAKKSKHKRKACEASARKRWAKSAKAKKQSHHKKKRGKKR